MPNVVKNLATVASGQDLPDRARGTLLLPTGGHIGFGPYASAWYYNLILNFFDPATGAAAGG